MGLTTEPWRPGGDRDENGEMWAGGVIEAPVREWGSTPTGSSEPEAAPEKEATVCMDAGDGTSCGGDADRFRGSGRRASTDEAIVYGSMDTISGAYTEAAGARTGSSASMA